MAEGAAAEEEAEEDGAPQAVSSNRAAQTPASRERERRGNVLFIKMLIFIRLRGYPKYKVRTIMRSKRNRKECMVFTKW